MVNLFSDFGLRVGSSFYVQGFHMEMDFWDIPRSEGYPPFFTGDKNVLGTYGSLRCVWVPNWYRVASSWQ
jgi:hypothetical protein